MSWLLARIADRPDVRQMLRAIDVLQGYPRTHPERELVRYGRGPHAVTVRTETQCAVVMDATRIAISVDDAVLALLGRQATIDAQAVTVRLNGAGWAVVETLPAGTWTPLAPRDGGAGSTTGVPVP